MAETLKPCPFCGKSVAEIDDARELEECPYFDDCNHAEFEQCSMHSVVCNIHKGGCGASSGYYVTVEDAIAAWNRRAERTCRYPVVTDEEELAERAESAKSGRVFGTQDVPLCRKCTACGAQFTPTASLPKWLKY